MNLIILLLNLMFFQILHGLDFSSGGNSLNLMPGGAAGDPLFQMPSPEEMAQIEEFLNSLSPEEMEELAKLGEQIIKEAEAEGRPLFANMPMPQPPISSPKTPEPSQPQENPTVEKTEEKINKEKMEQSIKQTIIELLENLSSLRQKAETDERYSIYLQRINPSLNILVYYLYIIRDSKHINHLTDKEFIDLKNEIINLNNDLKYKIHNLIIPNQLAEKKLSKHEKEQRKHAIITAEHIINDVALRLEKSLIEKKIIQECEKLLKKYEPEAVKIKEEQARKAKLALEQSLKPSINSNKPVAIPTYSMKTTQYTGQTRGSSTGSSIPSSYNNNRNEHDLTPSSRNNAPKKQNNYKNTDKKDDTKTDKPVPLTEVEKSSNKAQKEFINLQNTIKKADSIIRIKQDTIKSLIENKNSTQVSDPTMFNTVKEAFEEVTYYVNQAHEAYKEWSKGLNDYTKKTETGFREKQKAFDKYKNVINKEALAFKEFNQYLEALPARPEISDEKLDTFDPYIEEIQKVHQKITEKIQENESTTTEPKKKKRRPLLHAANISKSGEINQSISKIENDTTNEKTLENNSYESENII